MNAGAKRIYRKAMKRAAGKKDGTITTITAKLETKVKRPERVFLTESFRAPIAEYIKNQAGSKYRYVTVYCSEIGYKTI
jgi:hypothetical protein